MKVFFGKCSVLPEFVEIAPHNHLPVPDLINSQAEHWAIRCNDTWFEIAGAKKINNQPNEIYESNDNRYMSKVGATVCKILGSSEKTFASIRLFNKGWVQRHPKYNWHSHNCQQYVRDLCNFLNVSGLPMVQAGEMGHEDGQYKPRSNAVAGKGYAKWSAQLGMLEGRKGVFGGRAELPYASAEAAFSFEYGYRAKVEAALFNAEGGIGALQVRLRPNVDTGVDVSQGLDVNFIGFGLKLGKDGIGVNTPVGGASCTVM